MWNVLLVVHMHKSREANACPLTLWIKERIGSIALARCRKAAYVRLPPTPQCLLLLFYGWRRSLQPLRAESV